jgi:hypothetical protein
MSAVPLSGLPTKEGGAQTASDTAAIEDEGPDVLHDRPLMYMDAGTLLVYIPWDQTKDGFLWVYVKYV